jgi:hypothetical protein
MAPLLLEHYNTQEKIEALIMMGDTSSINETLEKCSPYADGTPDGEPYEDNAPEISDEWELHEDFYYEYFWDGQQWFYVMGRMLPKPLAKWTGEQQEEKPDTRRRFDFLLRGGI